MKSVLITGCCGFIAGKVAREFSSSGWKVIGIGHGTMDEFEMGEKGFSLCISADISVGALISINEIPDAIVHCASSASVGFSMQSPFEDFRMGALSIASVCEYSRLHAPKARVIYMSSAAVYGESEVLPTTENHPCIPRSPYGMHKKLGEEICESYARFFNVSSTVIRLFSVYGSGLRKQLLWDACGKIMKGNSSFFGTGDETRDWLHVKDAARLIFTAATSCSNTYEIINGGTGVGTSIRDVLEKVTKNFDLDIPLNFSGTVKEGDPKNYQADIKKSLTLGWKPDISLDEGLTDYVKWFRKVIKE